MGSLVLGGCSGGKSEGSDVVQAMGSLAGTLHVSGGPAPGFDSPAAGVVSITRGGQVVARIDVPATGRFSARLARGAYTISGTLKRPTDPCGSNSLSPLRATVRVRAGKTSTVELVCPIP
jgi:hypothetical protein